MMKEPPTVGDSNSTHRHLLCKALIPINDNEFWEGFLQHVNLCSHWQESNLKPELADDDEGNVGVNPLWSVIVKVTCPLLLLFNADLPNLAMRNIPSFASFVALLTQDFLPTSEYKLFSGRPHNWAEFFFRLLCRTMLPGFVTVCRMSFHPKFLRSRSLIPAHCWIFLIPIDQNTMVGWHSAVGFTKEILLLSHTQVPACSSTSV